MDTRGSRLRALRTALRLSQAALSKLLEVRAATVSDWEREITIPSRGNLRLVSDLAADQNAVYQWLVRGGVQPALEYADLPQGMVPDLQTLPEVPGPLTSRLIHDLVSVEELRKEYAGWVRSMGAVAAQAETVPSQYLLEIAVTVMRGFEVFREMAIELSTAQADLERLREGRTLDGSDTE